MMLSPELHEKFKAVRLFATDVDGVLTRGEITYTSSGEEIKSFDVKDGHGIAMWTKLHNKPCAIITARNSPVVQKRGEELGIQHILQGQKKKLEALTALCRQLNISLDAVCYIGDDTPDLDCIKTVGLGVCPADAVEEVKAAADYITHKKGGRGVARELLDLIFEAQGLSKV